MLHILLFFFRAGIAVPGLDELPEEFEVGSAAIS
jgi:hypothetical protein